MADAKQHAPQPLPVTRATSLLFSALLAALLAGAIGLAGWHVLRFASHSAGALASPYPLDGLEGTLLHEAWLLRAGEPLYQPLQLDRFVSSPYPPVHYGLLALLTAPDGAPHVFASGRLLSLGAMLLTTAALALAVLRLSGSLPATLLAAALWLAFPPVQLWATRVKPDPLALAFTALGLLAAVWHRGAKEQESRGTEEQGNKFQVLSTSLAAICFVLACFTKQTAVAAPLAVGLALLIEGCGSVWRAGPYRDMERRSLRSAGTPSHLLMLLRSPALRPALWFGLIYAGLVALIWLGLDLVTSGQYSFHVWGLHRSEWWSAALMLKFVGLLVPSWPLALLALLVLVLAGWRLVLPRQQGANLLVPACYLLVAPLTLTGAGEVGAHHNHLLETQLALTLAACVVAGTLIQHWISVPGRLVALAACGLLLLQLSLLRERPPWYGGEFDLTTSPARYVAFIRSQPGEVLADDVGLLLAAGRPLRYDDPSTMGPAISSGVWDERQLLAEVAAQRFSAILMPFQTDRDTTDATGRWSPAFISTLHQHYKILYRDRITSYVPR